MFRRIAAAVQDIRAAMQTALTARHSRLAVYLPEAARLGMENVRKADETDVTASIIRGDRELARCLIGLFEGTGLKVCAVFAENSEMEAAKTKFGPLLECSYDCWTYSNTENEQSAFSALTNSSSPKKSSSNRKRRSRASAAGAGFGAVSSPDSDANVSPGAVLADHKFDVYIVVAPKQKSMARVRRLCEKFGNDTLIILANARVEDMKGMPKDVSDYFSTNCAGNDRQQGPFEDVYYWKPDPCPNFAGGVLFRKFPDDWVLCRATPLGTVQRIFECPNRPTSEDITSALRAEAEKPATGILNRVADFINKNRS